MAACILLVFSYSGATSEAQPNTQAKTLPFWSQAIIDNIED
jgi:hypothetical protein